MGSAACSGDVGFADTEAVSEEADEWKRKQAGWYM